MVELSTLLEKTPPDKKLQPISNDDLLVVEVNVGVCIMLSTEKVFWRLGGEVASTGLPEQTLKGTPRDWSQRET